MDQYNQLVIGQVVRSIKGRDKGKVQLVINLLDESHVLVVDGKRRKLDKPKKKKIKHLQKFSNTFNTEGLNDSKVRKLLKGFE